MGIPSFFSHVIKQHGEILKKYCQSLMSIDNLYLDSNSIIYDVVNEMNKEEKFITFELDKLEDYIIKQVCIKIKEYIDKLKPLKKVYIAFDGVAPIAKLSQQRNRRFKTIFQSEMMREIGIEKKKINWETTSITPGTEFMNKLDKIIKKVFEKGFRLQDTHISGVLGSRPPVFEKYETIEMIISTSVEAGEGEHKIFEYIKNNVEYHRNTTTVVYGLDADLIMLALNHLHITNNLYLYRETPHFIKSIDNTLEPNSEYLLDIPLFAFRLRTILSGDDKLGHSNQDNQVIFDYIFMCFLLGNDFLPHFPALNIRTDGIDRLLSCYNTIQKKNRNEKRLIKIIYSGTGENEIIIDTKIVWKNVRELIKLMAENEDEYIQVETSKREKLAKNIDKRMNYKPSYTKQKNDTQEIEDRILSLPLLDRRLEEYIEPAKIGWESRYYKSLFDINIQKIEKNDLLKQICINYLEGLEWTWKYYMHGCIDWKWKYNYHYPPLLKHLLYYIPYFETDLLQCKEKNPVHQYVQLAYVLPKSSLGLLPSDVERNIMKNHTEWYNYSNKFVWAYCKYFWECHCELPEINIKVLEKLVNDTIKHSQEI